MSALKSPRDKIEALRWCLVPLVFAMIVWPGAASKSSSPGQGVGKGLPPSHTPSKGMEGRVVGGTVSRMNQFPYLIAMTDHGAIKCGGSLINQSLVLTAAHCWVDKNTGEINGDWGWISVRAAEHNLKSDDEGSEQHVDIKRLVVHKDFSHDPFVNDIALIEVSTPFNLTKAVRTVALATRRSKYRNTDCTVVGWGYTHPVTEADLFKPKLEPYPLTPSFVELDIIKKDECIKIEGTVEAAHPSVLCAAKLEGGKATCTGDSGSPLTCPSIPSGESLQVGIVSAAATCAQPNSATLFADVAFMEPWLKKAVKALKESKETIMRV